MSGPTRQELRAALVARQGERRTRLLEAATVAVCGLGGLGSAVALMLARSGVGRLLLFDFDEVDISNLHRQQYLPGQVGQTKFDALTHNLRLLMLGTEVGGQAVRLTEDNILPLLSPADVVIECFDDADAKAMLVDAVLSKLPTVPVIAASGMAGLGDGNEIVTRRLGRRLWVCGDGASDVSDQGTLYCPRVQLCAAHQALTAVRLLCEAEQ
ncbi:MAG: sulfur carrier protein ThiS adenylyltransferase ThiF [Clostridia bacterium]|nr:sulfur carrier protein ThiS adenylyltransferase ThiF [Clostridia bacterium]